MPATTCWPGKSVAALLRRSPGACGVAVIEESGLAWSRVVGGRPGLMFQAGSISKPVTALAALELAARGQAGLDGDVNEQLTSWQVPGPRPISLRQLLGHTSGMGVPFFPGYPQGADVPALRQVLDGIPPSVTPAVRADPARHRTFCYSGGGYAVIQQLIADITGQPFADAARALVLEPLGMTRSTFEQPMPAGLRPAAARNDWHVYPESAAAGLWTTPGDLARYVCACRPRWPASTSDGTGAVIMTAANPRPFPFRLLLAISDEHGWTGFRQPAWKRLHGLPGIRHLARVRAPEPAGPGGSN